MDVNFLQIALVFLVTFVAAIDQFDFTESLYQPIVTGPIIGAILGDVQTGLVVGGTYQLMTIGNMPIGGAQPPNAVIGGIMAAVFACTLDMDPNVAVATAIPFALLGQYGVTLFFTLRAPMMESFRAAAVKADTKAITKLTVVSEIILGLIFAPIVTPALATPELLIMAIIGFGIAFWDFQQQTELKGASFDGGDMSDGI